MSIKTDDFNYLIDQFADIKILRYKVDGFEKLALNKKILIYYLSQAALVGRDIVFDQNYKYNLLIRDVLENINKHYNGDRTDSEFEKFLVYLKRFWFSNGIHHHYSTDKIKPEFSEKYFASLLKSLPNEVIKSYAFTKDDLTSILRNVLFNKDFDNKRVCMDTNSDMIESSANNFYENVSQNEAEEFYKNKYEKLGNKPPSFGLNSKLENIKGEIVEKTWKVGGMYSAVIEKIIFYLKKAIEYTENENQKKAVLLLIDYYKTGDLQIFDKYSIAWLNDLASDIDFTNGFIENYGDPLGYKASWEAIVNFKNIEASKRTDIISKNAQWFENNSPINNKFRKTTVSGISAKVINIAILGGECYPTAPLGINLPNADWIRKEYGSKSVSLENIANAHHMASLTCGFVDEFAYTDIEKQRSKKYGFIANNLHTDLHECLGHGSGQLLEGVSSDALKNYSSPIEEARADLFALYFMMDEKMQELGLIPDVDIAITQYDSYIRNGLLTQITRIELGKSIEQAHMRNRQMVAQWCYEKGKAENVIEKITENNKTYFVINDYKKLQNLFGQLLSEIQRVKSEGDFEAAKNLIEKYGVKIDTNIHQEVLLRFKKLNIPPYTGFLNPEYRLITENDNIVDVEINYCDNYTNQMMEYSDKYSFLPLKN
ncbi:MAG: dihydrofolate reductase [Bacteroidota bacterium]|nr:dihydrofolate reductase [Bacteroidota bacterium]